MSGQSCKRIRPDLCMQPPRALYVHVPFCRGKCRYCDFYSAVFDSSPVRRYLPAVRRELDARRESLARPLQSIYLGGGTPTALGPDLLSELLAMLAPLADAATQLSIEANPCTVDERVAAALVAGGAKQRSERGAR